MACPGGNTMLSGLFSEVRSASIWEEGGQWGFVNRDASRGGEVFPAGEGITRIVVPG